MDVKPTNTKKATVQIRRWDVLDLYYNETNYEEVQKIVDTYVKAGWSKEGYDESGVKGYDGCIQLMRWRKPRTKRIT